MHYEEVRAGKTPPYHSGDPNDAQTQQSYIYILLTFYYETWSFYKKTKLVVFILWQISEQKDIHFINILCKMCIFFFIYII